MSNEESENRCQSCGELKNQMSSINDDGTEDTDFHDSFNRRLWRATDYISHDNYSVEEKHASKSFFDYIRILLLFHEN